MRGLQHPKNGGSHVKNTCVHRPPIASADTSIITKSVFDFRLVPAPNATASAQSRAESA